MMKIVKTSTSSQTNEVNVSGTKIIVAEKNHVIRSRMARALSGKAYSVETTGSAAHLMRDLLHRKLSVVVLGDGLEESLSITVLISLMKTCNPHLTIILVGDEVSPVEEIKVRQQGIFYRTNRPVCPTGWNELQLAVDCACNK